MTSHFFMLPQRPGEGLVLVKAKDAHSGKTIPLSELKLQLCTLPQSEDYWQETGRFEVHWAKSAA